MRMSRRDARRCALKASARWPSKIVEQLGWRFPDIVVCPTGGGTAVLALHQAFAALRDAGCVIGKPPRLFVSQYAGCAPIVTAYHAGDATVRPWQHVDTPRGGMRTASPSLGREVIAAIAGGGAYAVDPQAACSAARALYAADGVPIGLEGGTALAAARQALLDGAIAPDSTVVVVNAATALKSDPTYAIRQAATSAPPAGHTV
jgi:threonine synthase